MDGFICPHCGERAEIFPHSQETRNLLDELPLLGSIPLDPATVVSSDKGHPIIISMPDSPVAQAFTRMATSVVAALDIRSTTTEAELPSIQKEEDHTKTKEETNPDDRKD